MTNSKANRRVNMAKLIDANDSIRGDTVFAVRHCSSVAAGTRLEPSVVWEDGIPTDEHLDGTCALELRCWKNHSIYKGFGPLYLVRGRPLTDAICEDIGEIQLADCVVVCEIEPY